VMSSARRVYERSLGLLNTQHLDDCQHNRRRPLFSTAKHSTRLSYGGMVIFQGKMARHRAQPDADEDG